MEKTKNEFESGLKGFHGDLNLSLSVPVKDKNISAIQNSNIKITQLEDNGQDYNNNQDYNNPAHR